VARWLALAAPLALGACGTLLGLGDLEKTDCAGSCAGAGTSGGSALGGNTSAATMLASQQLEIMRRTPASALASVPAQTVAVGTQNFSRQATVSGTGTGAAKQVIVDVNWSDQMGPHVVHLVTVMAQS